MRKFILLAIVFFCAAVWYLSNGCFQPATIRLEGEVLQSGSPKAIAYCTFSQDSRKLLFASNAKDCGVVLFDLTTRKRLPLWEGIGLMSTAVSISPDEKWIAAGFGDETVRLWDVVAGKETAIFKGHYLSADVVEFSPDSALLASASFDGVIRVWDMKTKQQ